LEKQSFGQLARRSKRIQSNTINVMLKWHASVLVMILLWGGGGPRARHHLTLTAPDVLVVTLHGWLAPPSVYEWVNVRRYCKAPWLKARYINAIHLSLMKKKTEAAHLTLQCFKASLNSLFLMASLALLSAAFTSLLDIPE